MNRNEIKERVIVQLKKVLESNPVIENWEADLVEIGLTSVDYIKLIVAMEEEFDFELDDDSLIPENFKKLDDVVTLIEEKLLTESL